MAGHLFWGCEVCFGGSRTMKIAMKEDVQEALVPLVSLRLSFFLQKFSTDQHLRSLFFVKNGNELSNSLQKFNDTFLLQGKRWTLHVTAHPSPVTFRVTSVLFRYTSSHTHLFTFAARSKTEKPMYRCPWQSNFRSPPVLPPDQLFVPYYVLCSPNRSLIPLYFTFRHMGASTLRCLTLFGFPSSQRVRS